MGHRSGKRERKKRDKTIVAGRIEKPDKNELAIAKACAAARELLSSQQDTPEGISIPQPSEKAIEKPKGKPIAIIKPWPVKTHYIQPDPPLVAPIIPGTVASTSGTQPAGGSTAPPTASDISETEADSDAETLPASPSENIELIELD